MTIKNKVHLITALILLSSVLIISVLVSSCKETLEEYLCRQAEEFGTLYFNHKILESKEYCTSKMHPIMDFRNYNLKEDEKRMLELQIKPATVRTIYCDIHLKDERAYLGIEVKDFVHVDYLNDTSYYAQCDTIELVFKQMSVERNIWKIINPF